MEFISRSYTKMQFILSTLISTFLVSSVFILIDYISKEEPLFVETYWINVLIIISMSLLIATFFNLVEYFRNKNLKMIITDNGLSFIKNNKEINSFRFVSLERVELRNEIQDRFLNTGFKKIIFYRKRMSKSERRKYQIFYLSIEEINNVFNLIYSNHKK